MKELTDLQKSDLEELPRRAVPLYAFMDRLLQGHKFSTMEIAQARIKLSEAEHWIQQHIVRHGSGMSNRQFGKRAELVADYGKDSD